MGKVDRRIPTLGCGCPWGGFFVEKEGLLVKVIDIPDEDEVSDEFELFCEEYDIPVMDRSELFDIFFRSGKAYALRRWHEMEVEALRNQFPSWLPG